MAGIKFACLHAWCPRKKVQSADWALQFWTRLALDLNNFLNTLFCSSILKKTCSQIQQLFKHSVKLSNFEQDLLSNLNNFLNTLFCSSILNKTCSRIQQLFKHSVMLSNFELFKHTVSSSWMAFYWWDLIHWMWTELIFFLF